MFVILLASIMALYLTILDSTKTLKNGMAYAFVLVTLIACIRYNVGNDYMSYKYDFERVGKYSLSFIFSEQQNIKNYDSLFKDIGAVTLFRILHPFGFYIFAAGISIIQGCVFYQFIKENVSRKDYWIAIFIYLFNFDFYVLPMSMIRQGLVISMFVWSWHFIRQNRYLIPIVITTIGVTLHQSSIIIFPFLFIKFLPFNKGKLMATIFLCICVVFIVASGILNSLYSGIMELEAFKIYAGYEEEGGSKLGFIRKFLAYIPFILALLYIINSKFNVNSKALVAISIIGTLIIPFTSIVQLISRLCYYFNVFSIVAIPVSMYTITNKLVRYSIVSIILVLLFYQYIDIFRDSVYTNSFMEFHTIWSDLEFLYE